MVTRMLRITSISIHALLAESDADFISLNSITYAFLSTLSLRRATKVQEGWYDERYISIHALLADSDVFSSGAKADSVTISIHALLAESDG